MPMVKMKSGKTMKFPYTKKGKEAAKKAASKKMVHGGGVTKAKAGASIPAAKTVKMAIGGMVGKIRSSKVVGTEDEKDKKETETTTDIAGIGTSLLVKNLAKETEHNFQLVNPDDADPKTGKLPLTNPIAKALEGAKEGDEISVGPNTFKVIKLN